jgi:glycosyltransferase involved in cell wall biosynthesis
MAKMKLYLIDYNGVTDGALEPVGHAMGVAENFYSMLRDKYAVTYVAPKPYADRFCADETIVLPLNINLSHKTDKSEIVRKNLKYISQSCTDGILFFCHFVADYSVYLPQSNRNRGGVCVCFSHIPGRKPGDSLFKKIIRPIYAKYKSRGMKRARLIFKSNVNLRFFNKCEIYLPDYFFDAASFTQYRNIIKEDLTICLGQNHKEKKLVELIHAFRYIDKRLLILGKFFDDDFLNQCLHEKGDSRDITIENRYISRDEYYLALARAKFSVLPYDESFYYERTSGVLLDSLFSNTVPVAPETILKFNNLPGIGYKNLCELNSITLDSFDYIEFSTVAERLKNSVYDKPNAIQTVIENLAALVDKKLPTRLSYKKK